MCNIITAMVQCVVYAAVMYDGGYGYVICRVTLSCFITLVIQSLLCLCISLNSIKMAPARHLSKLALNQWYFLTFIWNYLMLVGLLHGLKLSIHVFCFLVLWKKIPFPYLLSLLMMMSIARWRRGSVDACLMLKTTVFMYSTFLFQFGN